MFKIMSDIPKPPDLPERRAGESKYPFGDMKVGDSFVVPYGEMKKGEKPEKFRQRVHKSAREYGRRNMVGNERAEFTVAIMTEDDKSEAQRYVAGDIVVWRDK